MENAALGVSERLRHLKGLKNMTIQEFADFLETPKGTLEKYLNRERPPNVELISKLYAKMNVSAHWLLDGIEPMYFRDAADLEALGAVSLRDGPAFGPEKLSNRSTENRTASATLSSHANEFVAIPRYDVEASAGFGSLVEAEIGSGFYAYNRAFLKRRGLSEEHLSVISVSGDSMEPELYDRDLILIATDQKEPRNGFMFGVYFDGQLYVKRVQRLPGNRLHLISTNDRYPPIIIDLADTNDVRIVGRVIASMHEW